MIDAVKLHRYLVSAMFAGIEDWTADIDGIDKQLGIGIPVDPAFCAAIREAAKKNLGAQTDLSIEAVSFDLRSPPFVYFQMRQSGRKKPVYMVNLDGKENLEIS